MKKWLFLFVIVDLVFVSLVLKYSSENQRHVASDNNSIEYQSLTDGQKRKFDLVQSLKFTNDANNLILTTDRLQLICETSNLIELKFTAMNTAFAGVTPTISHIYSCSEIKKDMSSTSLTTPIQQFVSMRSHKELQLIDSKIIANQIYSDEDFPTDWKLSEISISGANTFTIYSAEIDKIHTNHSFEFTLDNQSTYVK